MNQHTQAGMVLCLGADGHVDVENGRSGDCAIVGNDAARNVHFGNELPPTTRNTTDCGPCIDIAVFANAVDSHVGISSNNQPADIVAVTAVLTGEKTYLHPRDLIAPVSIVRPVQTVFGPVVETAPVALLL